MTVMRTNLLKSQKKRKKNFLLRKKRRRKNPLKNSKNLMMKPILLKSMRAGAGGNRYRPKGKLIKDLGQQRELLGKQLRKRKELKDVLIGRLRGKRGVGFGQQRKLLDKLRKKRGELPGKKKLESLELAVEVEDQAEALQEVLMGALTLKMMTTKDSKPVS